MCIRAFVVRLGITCYSRARACCWRRLLQHTTAHGKTATHCTTLHNTATHYNTLQHTATYCNARQRTATHGTTRQHTAPHCTTLHHTAPHCTTLQHNSTYCITPKREYLHVVGVTYFALQSSATHCDTSTLQRTATHCNTLQHTATHFDTSTLKHTATHCYTLRRSAIHCNTLQREHLHVVGVTYLKRNLFSSRFSPLVRLYTHISHISTIGKLICINLYTYIHTYIHIYICIYICTYIYTYVYRYIYIHTYMYMLIYVYIYMYIFIYIFTYVYIKNLFQMYSCRDDRKHRDQRDWGCRLQNQSNNQWINLFTLLPSLLFFFLGLLLGKFSAPINVKQSTTRNKYCVPLLVEGLTTTVLRNMLENSCSGRSISTRNHSVWTYWQSIHTNLSSTHMYTKIKTHMNTNI